MRTLGFLFLGATATLGALIVVTGCYSLGTDCDLNFNCTSGAGGSGGGTGGAGGAPPSCVPSNNSSPVENECGIFVSTTNGDDGNDGSKEAPVFSFFKAFELAKGKPVYACGEKFLENVEINASALVYGGLDCTKDWQYDATEPTELTASPGAIPLQVGAQTSLDLYDVKVRSEDATLPGRSSIALLAEGDAEVKLTRCSIEAGAGSNGANGEDYLDTGIDGNPGFDGGEACSANTVLTLDGPVNQCGEILSIGGLGGIGSAAVGGAGSPGQPDGAVNAGVGEGAAVCTAGSVGNDGVNGTPGDGALSQGGLSAGVGFTGSDGTDGKPGAPAQGGGGGGGAKGGTGAGKCTVAGSAGGASGGTGAAGGCGGLGGKGGTVGGASIAIVSLGARLTFVDVTIAAKSGGKGGNGGLGQPGGPGGIGGKGGVAMQLNLKSACSGGDGGKGGNGGKGGGGRGGHSIGIAHIGDAPDMAGATITVATAGNGGTGEGETGSGAPGVASKTQAF